MILRTIISVNQHSIYAAAADLCKELSKDSEVTGKTAANEYLETLEIPTKLPIADPPTRTARYEHELEQLPGDQKLSKNCAPTPV